MLAIPIQFYFLNLEFPGLEPDVSTLVGLITIMAAARYPLAIGVKYSLFRIFNARSPWFFTPRNKRDSHSLTSDQVILTPKFE